MKTATTVIAVAIACVALCTVSGRAPHAAAQSFTPISGSGSTWAAIAIEDMRANVAQFGMTVNYAGSGSSAGRADFITRQVAFAASDIPFQFDPEDGSAPEQAVPGTYSYIPVTAGGTAFAYNLKIGGKPVTNLRLSGENVAKIFTGVITTWNDPAIAADNPGLVLPARTIQPVVRSDGSGSTAQFTRWMIAQHPAIWNDFCERSGRAPKCGVTSTYPEYQGMLGQSGDFGVIGTVTGPQSEGAIGYVNYSYAIGSQAPVVKVLNAAGYYTEPTPENVAVSLLQADINRDATNPSVYLTQVLDGVYTDTDPRNYPLSSYSYFVLPSDGMTDLDRDAGYTLGRFATYAMCEAQQRSASLGYSPLPISLVEPSLEQIRKIPGAVVDDIDVTKCNNPTFDPANPRDPNRLATLAPQPQECDRQGPLQCSNGTGGRADEPTAVVVVVAGGSSGGGGGGGTSGGGGAIGGDAAGGAASDGAGSGETSNGGAGPAAGGGTGAAPGSVGAAGGAPAAAGAVAGGATAGPAASGSIAPDGQAAGGVPVVTGDQAVAGCDPDTGECGAQAEVGGGAVDPATGQVASIGAANVGAVTPTNLDGGPGLGQAVLIVLIVVLLMAIVLAPPYAWRYFSAGMPA